MAEVNPIYHLYQEIPYVIEHRLMDWKELRDGSLRVEQHFITPKPSQRQILIGKNGSKIGYYFFQLTAHVIRNY